MTPDDHRSVPRARVVAALRRAGGHAGTALATVVLGALAALGGTEPQEFLLIDARLEVSPIWLVEIDRATLAHRTPDGWTNRTLDDCIGIMSPERIRRWNASAWLMLNDGQMLPGGAARHASPPDAAPETVMWEHRTLGLMAVPLDRIASVTFDTDTVPPRPTASDVVLLTNGDRLEGFVTSLSDPLMIEVDGAAGAVAVTIDRVAAVAIVAPARAPDGTRVWLNDGTVIDVEDVLVADDGSVRVSGVPFVVEGSEARIDLVRLRGVLFRPGRMTPLAALRPTRIDGPPTRYTIPSPTIEDPLVALGVADIRFDGPVTVRYPLDATMRRFATEVELPLVAREWGDCEVIIRDDDREVFRTRLTGERPTATINVELRGSELTVEISEGRYGPIQDRVVLRRAMLTSS
ncbi:MAG: hypothetical protein KDA25_07365 [Phycisphaerales bacterium]|nr:hypothetical protein [Phycisphaerales bacterium]